MPGEIIYGDPKARIDNEERSIVYEGGTFDGVGFTNMRIEDTGITWGANAELDDNASLRRIQIGAESENYGMDEDVLLGYGAVAGREDEEDQRMIVVGARGEVHNSGTGIGHRVFAASRGVAIGRNSAAGRDQNDTDATAVGNSSEAHGNAVAVGRNSFARASSVSIGDDAKTEEDGTSNSVAIGRRTYIAGEHTIVIGSNGEATEDRAMLLTPEDGENHTTGLARINFDQIAHGVRDQVDDDDIQENEAAWRLDDDGNLEVVVNIDGEVQTGTISLS